MAFWQFATLLIVVNSAIWTHFDAAKLRDGFHLGVGPRGLPPHRWSAMVFLFFPVAFPFYLSERQRATLQEPRTGAPPRFVVGGLDGFAIGVGLVGLGLFGFLLVRGELVPSVIGLVIAVAGVFGGRRCRITAESERIELGELGFDQKGFALPPSAETDDEDAPPPEEIEKYFSNLGGPRTPGQPPAAPRPSPAGPSRQPPPPPPPPGQPPPAPDSGRSAGSPPAGVPYDPPPSVPYDPPPPGPRRDASPPAPPGRATIPLPPPVEAAGPRATSPPENAPPDRGDESPKPPPVRAAGPRSAPDADPRPPRMVEARPAPPPARAISRPAPPAAARPIAGPRPAGPRPGSPPRRAAPMPGYGVAAKAGPSTGQRVVIALAVVSLLAVAGWGGWAWWSSRDAAPEPPPIGESRATEAPGPVDEPFEPAPVAEEPPPPAEAPPPAAEGGEVLEQQVIQPWLSRYNDVMAPLGQALDEIDFNGFDEDRCQNLRAALARANRLTKSPDAEIEKALRPAFESFSEAWDACRAAKDVDWSRQLLEGKQATHEAQVLMDRRYGYAGILELELEGAIGVERSPESISGRYLLGDDGLGLDDPGFEEPGFDESYPEGEPDGDNYDETG